MDTVFVTVHYNGYFCGHCLRDCVPALPSTVISVDTVFVTVFPTTVVSVVTVFVTVSGPTVNGYFCGHCLRDCVHYNGYFCGHCLRYWLQRLLLWTLSL